MNPALETLQTPDGLPKRTSVVIIGGGIVGVCAALTLAEQKIPVVLLEKGSIAGEQSSRNLGWIRKTNRHAEDIPLALLADQLWHRLPERIGRSVGYQQAGIVFVAANEAQMAPYEGWLKSVESLSLGSRLLSQAEIEQRIPGGKARWAGAIYTASDGYAEPGQAAPGIAGAAMRKGAILIQNCAARTLTTTGGQISGVVTEHGEIACEQVLLAGGAWSRRFLGHLGIGLPTLPLICSVLQTRPLEGPTRIAVGGPNFSFRKHQHGGFIITQRGHLKAPLTLDHLLLGWRYLKQLRTQGSQVRVSFGRHFFKDLALARRWKADSVTPFERIRTQAPRTIESINQEALSHLRKAWPVFEDAAIEHSWAGLIDVTPDSTPVIDQVAKIPGLTVATGFSGHGFGTGPAAGQVAAEMLIGAPTSVDLRPYRMSRF